MMKISFYIISALTLLVIACGPPSRLPAPTSSADLLSDDPEKWTAVNSTFSDWTITESSIQHSGKISGYLRSKEQYDNYILEFEQLSAVGSNAVLMVSSTALPAQGSPYPEGISIPVKKGTWNKYRVEHRDRMIKIFTNNKQTGTITDIPYRSGYFCLTGDSAVVQYRNIRITELPSDASVDSLPLLMQKEFTALYAAGDLSQWEMKPGHTGHWTPLNWVIDYDGKSSERDKSLWTKRSFRDFILIADVRLTRKPEMAKAPVILPSGENALNADGTNKEVDELYAGDTGIYLRGNSKSQINIGLRYIGSGEIYGYRVDKSMPAEVRAAVTPKVKADKPAGEWNRFIITMKGDRVTIELNGITVINNAQLPGIPESGPIALQDDHATNNTFQFANLFIKEL